MLVTIGLSPKLTRFVDFVGTVVDVDDKSTGVFSAAAIIADLSAKL